MPASARSGGTTQCCPPPRGGELRLESETDRLRVCLVHAPGNEIDKLIPTNYRFHLYDDLLHLGRAQREHAMLREVLQRFGAEVHEFTDLLAGVYEGMSSTDRHRFLRRVHAVSPGAPQYVLRELGQERDPVVVARALVEGVEATNSFAAEVRDALYYLQPMANLMFMQDVAVVLLNRVVQGYMSQLVRMPEEAVVETVIRSSPVFGPRGTGEFWLDPDFRKRHRMERTARDYVQLDAAQMTLRMGSVEAPPHVHPSIPAKVVAERVHIELENSFSSEGRHVVLEGGNLLALRRTDGRTVVLVGHNARASADAIDELAYRLLRDDGRRRTGEVGAVVVIDTPGEGDEARHLDTRVLAVGPNVIAADRTLVQAPSGLGSRFFVFLPQPDRPPRSRGPRREREFSVTPKVELLRCPTFEAALAQAGLAVEVRWIPAQVPWESPSPMVGPAGSTPVPPQGSDRWVQLQQSLWARALNLLVVAPSVFVGWDRHAAFYREELGFATVEAERQLISGEYSSVRCCALLAALREGAGGRPVVVLIRGDELSRARGGARSLVMPLLREQAVET